MKAKEEVGKLFAKGKKVEDMKERQKYIKMVW